MPSSQSDSLKWAINELSNQRDELDGKLQVAQKRDETNALIDEVFAQKKALEQRISALEDGLKISTELVDTPCLELESEMSKIDEKLEIAKERLHAIEQEEYLEELGKSLNRSHLEANEELKKNSPLSDKTSLIDDLEITPSKPDLPIKPMTSAETSPSFSPISTPSASTSTSVMKSTTNRIQEQNIEAEKSESPKPTMTATTSQTALSLEETAQKLGIDPEFLADKGINAILRMIARNGGKLSFPLEVDQIG